MKVGNRWFGVLSAENVDAVADVMREILKGPIAIAEVLDCEGPEAQLRLISADCKLDSEWTSAPRDEPVRVFRPTEGVGSIWIGFSAGHYFWSFNALPGEGHDHENYRYAYFSFEYDKFTVTQRAGAGGLHKRVFGAHPQS